MDRNWGTLIRYAWLSIATALATIALKAGAYMLTGSVGLLSDALEGLVNVAGAFMALFMLKVASQPPDEEHAYGHTKAEYFSSGVEGSLILLAALSIAYSAVRRLLNPVPLEQLGLGIAVSALASIINLTTALLILRAGKRHDSITLEANGQHLMTDVWTSAGVLLGVGLVAITGYEQLDPILALLFAANIFFTGLSIVRKSALGLMDTALPEGELAKVKAALAPHMNAEVRYHALRTRRSGARRFISFHVLVPGPWTVHRGHKLLEKIEASVRAALDNVTVFTHLESVDDKASFEDERLDREQPQ
jgi:cation diffusion facilitator family transporter